MKQYKSLWLLLIGVLIVTFSILGYLGREVYRQAPPIPKQFVSQNGEVIISHEQILQGQSAWQTTGECNLALYWVMVRIKRQTGQQTGCIVNWWRG